MVVGEEIGNEGLESGGRTIPLTTTVRSRNRERQMERFRGGEGQRHRGWGSFHALVYITELSCRTGGKKNDCNVVQQSTTGVNAQTGGYLCTLGPVLNAARMLQWLQGQEEEGFSVGDGGMSDR